jgi:hypothetical protein
MAPQITEPLVELAVVDRPGVPAELYDRYWITEVAAPWPGMDGGSAYEAGQVGTTARILLPPMELALGADDGRVASVLLDRDSGGVTVGPGGATILVRDIRTGALLRKVASPALPLTDPHRALVFDSLLIWTAWSQEPSTDGGLWALDLDAPEAAPKPVLSGGGDLAALGKDASRGPLHISASGQTLISVVGGSEGSRTDVIDVSRWTISATLEGTAFSTGDESAIVRRATGVGLVDLETGKDIGSMPTGTIFAVFVADSEAYIAFAGDQRYIIAAIDLQSGEHRDVLVQSGGGVWYLSRDLSSGSNLVLLPETTIGSSFDAMGLVGRTTATILDPATGAVRQDAFTVGAP